MDRSATNTLINWKNGKRRKPLIVRGARQIGKTWTIEQFGRKNYNDIYKIDFEKRPDLHYVFDGNLDPKIIISQLEVLLNIKINIENILLFFDEIQECPKALASLRYFYEEMPELHIIAAGSLLEFELSNISFPVGRVQFLDMYPCTFYEFLCATGKNMIAEKLLGQPIKLPKAIHLALLAELKNYFFVGGMPEAIKVYTDNLSMLDAFDVQSEIVDAYRQDFSKYSPKADQRCLNMVLNSVSAMAGEQIKYSKLAEGFSNPTIHKAFDLLENARVIRKIRSISGIGLPLGIGCNNKRFKAAIVDIGLMQKLSHVSVSNELHQSNLLAMFRGKLAEQFVAQELLASQGNEIFYWSRNSRSSSSEVDFVIELDNKIIPLEVKSGKGGSLRSLHFMLEKYDDCPFGMVLYSGEFAELPEQKLNYIPLYYAGSLFNC
jgi:predicted AAA+ superfamily ATPase